MLVSSLNRVLRSFGRTKATRNMAMKMEAMMAASLRPVGYSWPSRLLGSGVATEACFSP